MNARVIFGYIFIITSLCGVLMVLAGLYFIFTSPFDSDLVNILANMSIEDRTIETFKGPMILPKGIFIVSALLICIILFIVLVNIIKYFADLGSRLIVQQKHADRRRQYDSEQQSNATEEVGQKNSH